MVDNGLFLFYKKFCNKLQNTQNRTKVKVKMNRKSSQLLVTLAYDVNALKAIKSTRPDILQDSTAVHKAVKLVD